LFSLVAELGDVGSATAAAGLSLANSSAPAPCSGKMVARAKQSLRNITLSGWNSAAPKIVDPERKARYRASHILILSSVVEVWWKLRSYDRRRQTCQKGRAKNGLT
jgi:hypothetical protein